MTPPRTNERTKGLGTWRRLAVLSLIVLLMPSLGGCFIWGEIPYSNPAASLGRKDIAGVWWARYTPSRIEWLVIREDGTFKQIYQQHYPDQEAYDYEGPWSTWWLETLPDGRIRLHLSGARYFVVGRWGADLYARDAQRGSRVGMAEALTYDTVDVTDGLVLSVRMTVSGAVVLLSPLDNWDAGSINLFSGRATGFHRLEPDQ